MTKRDKLMTFTQDELEMLAQLADLGLGEVEYPFEKLMSAVKLTERLHEAVNPPTLEDRICRAISKMTPEELKKLGINIVEDEGH